VFLQVSELEFNVPFQHKHGYIRGEVVSSGTVHPGSPRQRAVKQLLLLLLLTTVISTVPDLATCVGLRQYHNDYCTQITKIVITELQQLMTNELINHKNFCD